MIIRSAAEMRSERNMMQAAVAARTTRAWLLDVCRQGRHSYRGGGMTGRMGANGRENLYCTATANYIPRDLKGSIRVGRWHHWEEMEREKRGPVKERRRGRSSNQGKKKKGTRRRIRIREMPLSRVLDELFHFRKRI